MKDDEEFKKALADKQVPILVLDEKWHRLFAVHGKPDEIHETENELNALLARQGKLNEELKQLKKVKKQLMESIVANMDGTTSEDMDAQREKKLDEDKRLIDETNQKMEENEDELLEIPRQIRDVNRKLMLQSMGYFYEKIRVNKKESDDIDAWINQVRVDLKKNIIRKQNRDINNREIYAYLHDIFGSSTLDRSIFTMKMKMWKRTAHKINKTIRKNHKRKRRVRNLALSCIGKRNEASGSEYIAGVSCTGTGIDGTGIDGFCAEAFTA
ncbi:MAG: hypothetical protein ACLROW_04305 [Roseburia faecis]